MKKNTAIDLKKEVELLTAEQQIELEKKLPKWVQELAADGTAVLRWNQEFLLLVEELLRTKFDFTEADMVKLEKGIKETLPYLHKMAIDDLVILRPRDMQAALGIVEKYKQMEKAGIALPAPKKFLK